MMNEFLNQIATFGGGALTTAATLGLLKGPVQTFQDWWYINYGYNSNETAALLKAKTEINVEKLKNEALKEMSKIEPENIKEPEMIVLGPTLEASKYYIDHEELRSMFAKLLASSMDKSKDNITHSAYVEMIKQMSPLDAENLKCIFDSFPDSIPTCNLKIIMIDGSFNTVFNYLFINNNETMSQQKQTPSISNLQRLGLINIDFSQYIIQDEKYDKFKDLIVYKELEQTIEKNAIEDVNNRLSHPELQKGIITLTPFGQNFCTTCF